MWKIIKNEWSALSRNKVLLGISAGFLLVLFLSVFMGIRQNQTEADRNHEAEHKLRDQWENLDSLNPHGAAHYGTYVFKPANLLSSLDEGVNSVTGNVLRVEGHVQNEIVHSEASQVAAVSSFGKLKSSLLLQYVLPLLLLFLAFNSVSSEKRSGRLKLLVLQGAKPGAIVWAKTISVWLFGVALLALTVLVYALLNLGQMDGEIAGRTFFFFLSYTIYYFIVCGLTVLFSARWQNSTVALTSMLGIWMLWTIFLPNIVLSSVEKWHELPSRNTFQAGMKEDRAQGIDGHNPSDERGKALEAEILKEYGVDSVNPTCKSDL
ncbi:MAG: ABC transporter permease [Bacteroidota bacterium]